MIVSGSVILIALNLYFLFLSRNVMLDDLLYFDLLCLLYLAFVFLKNNREEKAWKARKKELLEDTEWMAADQEPDFENRDLLEHDLQIASRQKEKIYQMNAELEDYISNWAHEIKIPLSVLYLSTEEQQENILNSRGLNNEEELKDLWMQSLKEDQIQLERINRMVEAMLDSKRITSMTTDIRIQKISLNPLIRKAVRDNSRRLIRSRFQIRVPDSDFQVYSDPHWIGYVLSQLIDNAVKYRKKGIQNPSQSDRIQENQDIEFPEIRFELVQRNDRILLRVCDNGQGILAEDLSRIFDRGYTGNNLANASSKSTGMGLYFSRMILEKLNASITCYSEPGKETCFEISFAPSDLVQIQKDAGFELSFKNEPNKPQKILSKQNDSDF